MPLKPGKRNISDNISKLMKEYEEDGMIGNSKPKNKEEALRMAIAIALGLAKPPKKK